MIDNQWRSTVIDIQWAVIFVLSIALFYNGCKKCPDLPKNTRHVQIAPPDSTVKGGAVVPEHKVTLPPVHKKNKVSPVGDNSTIEQDSFVNDDSLRVYLNHYRDSTIDIESVDTVVGFKYGITDFKYKLLKSQMTVITDSIPYPVYVPEKKSLFNVYAGGVLSMDSIVTIGADIALSFRKTMIGYSYDPIRKQQRVSYKLKIFGR